MPGKSKEIYIAMSVAALMVPPFAFAAAPPQAKAKDVKSCSVCHKPADGQMRAFFDSVGVQSQVIQLKLDSSLEMVKFDLKTLKIVNGSAPGNVEKSLRAIKKGHEVRVAYAEGPNGIKVISELSIKPAMKVPPEKQYKVEEVEELLKSGKKYTLVDARPPLKVQEGTIPTAVNIPLPVLQKGVEKLPKDKNELIVFFCAGVTWALSPSCAREAEKNGYTNVKIFHDGIPEWNKRNYLVLNAQALKEAWLDKELSFVLLDVRPEKEAQAGFIKGAVNIPEQSVDEALKGFPSKDLKPPIVVYDAKGDGSAEKVARKLVQAGYPGPRVVTGGYAAWQGAKYAVESGKPATKVAYVPKPKAGAIAVEDFKAFAKGIPPQVQILDVRSKEEVDDSGMIKSAINIPADEVAGRLGDIPREKSIVVHCSSGARAEMAYNILKEKGYKVQFLDSEIANYEDGSFKIK